MERTPDYWQGQIDARLASLERASDEIRAGLKEMHGEVRSMVENLGKQLRSELEPLRATGTSLTASRAQFYAIVGVVLFLVSFFGPLVREKLLR